ncbi:MAG: acetate kinase [Bacteroidota bacterium]
MKILVLNAGSSSLKYQLFNFPEQQVLVSGLVERIGEQQARIKHKLHTSNDMQIEDLGIPDHRVALEKVSSLLLDRHHALVNDPDEIQAVGHRVVHGGEKFSAPTLIASEDQLNELQKLSYLAPLHNPANITGIKVAIQVFPKAKQVAVFDTAFHQTLPDHVFRYAVPNELYRKHGLRAYGFHGTSHQYVSKEAARFLGIDPKKFNAISIHLGNGCSMTAIKNGRSVDTSMGLTPIGGLVMGTRPGDFDPSLILFLATNLNMNLNEIDELLNKRSGFKGLTNENDLREIIKRYEANDPEARLAIQMYVYRIKKYIGAYMAALGHLEAIIFTAGVGENSAFVREKVCEDLKILGIVPDNTLNLSKSTATRAFQKPESRIKLLVVPTNEELEIANETVRLLT